MVASALAPVVAGGLAHDRTPPGRRRVARRGQRTGRAVEQLPLLQPRGRVIQVEADLGKLEANHPALGVHADALLTLEALAGAVARREADGDAEKRVAEVLALVADRLAGQELSLEQQVLGAVRAALPDDAPSFWDMTILAYWAWSAWDARTSGSMQSAQGAGGLGYGFPAALGAAVALAGSGPVLAVSGDGGAMYGLADLATARQLDLDVTWLIVDDGGYGILREYMTGAFGAAYATELTRPDFVALAEAFGVPGRRPRPRRCSGTWPRRWPRPAPASSYCRRCCGCSRPPIRAPAHEDRRAPDG